MELVKKFMDCVGLSAPSVKPEEQVVDFGKLIEILSDHKVSAVSHLKNFSVNDLNQGIAKAKGEMVPPIFIALVSDEKAFDEMVRRGVYVHALDDKGDSLFMHAVKNGLYDKLEKIKNLDVNINRCNNEGEYPVHAATRRIFDRRFVYKLIELGADFTVRNAQGKTARSLLVEDLKSIDTRLTKRNLREAYPHLSGVELNKNIAEETNEVILAVKQAERKALMNKKGFKAKLVSFF